MFDFDKLGEKIEVPGTYEEWLDECAKTVQHHPLFFAGRSVFKFLRYTQAREAAFLEILASRGMWGGEDSELLNTKTAEKSKEINKETLKEIMRQSTTGSIKFPGVDGSEVTLTPDMVISAFNEFLVSDKDLDASSMEILAGLVGVSEDKLRERYRKVAEAAAAVNGLTTGFNDLLEQMKASRAETTKRKAEREQRRRDLEIYVSKCKIAGVAPPTWKDRMDMLSGDKPIPEKAE